MQVTSIDNCYEDDGIANLVGTLMALNRQNPNDPTHQRIVAIVPEYSGQRLDRLNVLTTDSCDPGELERAEGQLFDATGIIVENLQRHRAAAMKQLDEAPLPEPVQQKD